MSRKLVVLVALVAGSLVVAALPADAAGEGAISGRVTDVRTGQPVGDICAAAMRPGITPENYEGLVEVGRARTGADGRYTIASLPPQTDYRVVFTDCSDRWSRYVESTWKGFTGSQMDGTPVTVTTATTTGGIDPTLAQTGVFQPIVRDASGALLRDALIEVEPVGHELTRELPDTRTTNADGRPQPMALVPGLYRVKITDQRQGLLPEWIDDRPWREEADLVSISSAWDTTPEVRLGPGTSIDGTVVDAVTGGPVEGRLIVRRADDPNLDVASTHVRNGAFHVGPLPPGRYKLHALGESLNPVFPTGITGGTGWVAAWVGGGSFTSATTYTATIEQPVTGVRVALAPGGAIRGQVRGPGGSGLAQACITAFDASGREAGTGRTIESGGHYEVQGLAPGSYRVRFEDCSQTELDRAQSFVHRWSGDGRTLDSATPVDVRTNEVTTANAELTELGGSISGQVTGLPADADEPAACVQARPTAVVGEPPLTPRPAWRSYELRGLSPGAWDVGAAECRARPGTSPGSHPFLDPTSASVASVPVASGVRRTGVDLALSDRVRRLAGATRIETAAAVSSATFPAATHVVLARSDDYADGLTGGPLAGTLDAPLLLTPGDQLAAATAAEIRRSGARDVVVLGGTSVLGREVTAGLDALGVRWERVAGVDRYETARLVAARVGGTSAYVVEGRNADPNRGWPDAVAVSALAAAEATPILLVERDRLPEPTRQALSGRSTATIVGGTSAVSAEVERAVDAEAGTVRRVAGVDRYATSASLTAGQTSRPWVATGEGWADALAAGPAAAHVGSPLLLAHGRTPTEPTLVRLGLLAGTLERVTIAGDHGALSPATEAAFRRRFAVEPPWTG